MTQRGSRSVLCLQVSYLEAGVDSVNPSMKDSWRDTIQWKHVSYYRA